MKQTLINWSNPMIKVANNIQHMLVEQAARPKAKDIPFGDSDYPGHVIGDYLYGVPGLMPLGGHAAMRANTSQVLAEAAGIPSEDISWTVKYPMLSTLAGIVGGAGLGGAAGLGVTRHEGKGDQDLGLLIGALGGGLGGGLLTTLARRKAMKEIAQKFDTVERLNELKPENLGFLASLGKALYSPVHPAIRDGIIQQTAGFTKKPD